MQKLTTLGKISIAVVIVFLAMLWIFPMWRIDLAAPQYPGGLMMEIWLNDVKGDVEIINGLNHYIGMMEIHKEDFAEFKYLPMIIGAFCGLGVLVFLWGRKLGYYIWFVLFAIIGIGSMYSFWSWEQRYGSELDPHAPIQVPGMEYSPPLIGYKKLLNFEVLSQPHIGGWFFIMAGVVMAAVCFWEWKKGRNVVGGSTRKP